MARPRVSQAEKRSVKFSFRLTEAEQLKLFQLAETLGRAPGVVARDKIFKGRFPDAKLSKIDLLTYVELKKIGVNLNQVVRRINSGKFPLEFMPMLNKLLSQQDKIIVKLFYDSQSENR